MAANSSSSPSLSSSSIPPKDSSQDRQLLPAAATSPPLGSDLSLATTYATVSGTVTSPPLGSDLSLATTNATVSGNVTSPPLGSDLSLATTNATVSGNVTSPPLGSDLSLAQPNATVSVTGESPPPGSNLSMSQPNANASGTITSPPLDRSLVPPQKSQKTEAGSSAGSSLRNLQSMIKEASSIYPSSQDRERPPTQQALPETNSPAKQKSPSGIMDEENLGLSSETPKSSEKPKAINFPVSKITIGQWTHTAVYPDDLKAKFYFKKKKLMWEILDNVQTGTQVPRLKRKIEIQWADVLSLRKTFHSHDETGTLEVELGKRPTFFVETNPQAGKHTQWKQMDQDFTLNQSASKCRRHTLHFAPGVLQKNFEKIMSSDSFWSKFSMVTFPVLPPYFDIGYGNNNNNSSRYDHCQTLSSNVNNDLLQYIPQGLAHVPDHGEVNFNMATHFCVNDGRLMNSLAQVNRQNETMNQLPGTQVIHPPSQLINRGGYFSGSEYSNPMSQMMNTGELRGSQALLDSRTNYSMVNQHMNEVPSTHRAGPYPQGYFVQGETQNTEHTHHGYGQNFSNEDGSMPPDL